MLFLFELLESELPNWGLEAGIGASGLGFGPPGWSWGALSLGMGPQCWNLELEAGISA